MNEIRDEIIKRIETKKGSADKLQSKADNLKSQREMYLAAIEDYKEKIVKLEALVAQRDDNSDGYADDAALRSGEAEHMEEILERFDKAVAERSKVVGKIQERLSELPNWMPGMDDSLKGLEKRDPKIKKLNARRDYLDEVVANALPDVKKIFYSRGVVSGINVKGRKDV